tara:strand:- start:196 stop:906 length:711 start_codon:yes stop_codon:yes gene_type:complete
MPDYGDERGFRSRGVPADIGFDRAGPGRGWQSRPQGPHVDFGPPSNIGRDRAGGFGMNDIRQLFPETGRNLADLLDRRGRRQDFPLPDDLPFPRYPRGEEDLDRTTIPEGFNPPDEYGRMRPTIPNPYEGGKIGGGWDDYDPPRNSKSFWERYREEEMRPMGEAAYMSPNPWGEGFPLPPGRPPIGRPPWGGGEFDIATSDEYRQWNSIRRKYGEEVANQMMGHVTANRGGIMGLI